MKTNTTIKRVRGKMGNKKHPEEMTRIERVEDRRKEREKEKRGFDRDIR